MKNAIKTLQEFLNSVNTSKIVVDGLWGPNSQRALDAAAVTHRAQLRALITTLGLADKIALGDEVRWRPTSRADVLAAQRFLVSKGYSLRPDGLWGPRTQREWDKLSTDDIHQFRASLSDKREPSKQPVPSLANHGGDSISLDMVLGRSGLTLRQLCDTRAAKRKHRIQPSNGKYKYTPQQVVDALTPHAEFFVDLQKELPFPIMITSGFREGGKASGSAHSHGCAIDIAVELADGSNSYHQTPEGRQRTKEMITTAYRKLSALTFDQLLVETGESGSGYVWLHISLMHPDRKTAPRRSKASGVQWVKEGYKSVAIGRLVDMSGRPTRPLKGRDVYVS